MPVEALAAPPVLDDEEGWVPVVPMLREPNFSQSLERGLAILGCFSPEEPVLGISDFAERLGMSRPTTHRYVTTLVALGYMQRAERRKYRATLRVTDLGMAAMSSTGLREHAHPYIEELCRETSFSVSLAVLDGEEILYVDRVQGTRGGQGKVGLGLARGARLPAYCTALGKTLLAHLPEGERERVLEGIRLVKRTPNTITRGRALHAELARIREDGPAVNDQELAVGLHSIAVPVRDGSGEVRAAVGMAAYASMIALEDLVEYLAPHLITTADRISARLGYRRADEQVGGR